MPDSPVPVAFSSNPPPPPTTIGRALHIAGVLMLGFVAFVVVAFLVMWWLVQPGGLPHPG